MKDHNAQTIPTIRQLAKATAVAMSVAVLLLITVVLPAEYGIDPTGAGRRLGLLAMSPSADEAASDTLSINDGKVESSSKSMSEVATITLDSQAQFQTDELSLTLNPSEGAEIKASMRQGDLIVFHWSTDGGLVNFDMHGERFDAKDEFTSYKKGSQLAFDKGSFTAPFDGTHGWYWRNRSDSPITVKVNVSGFYEKIARKS